MNRRKKELVDPQVLDRAIARCRAPLPTVSRYGSDEHRHGHGRGETDIDDSNGYYSKARRLYEHQEDD